MWGGFLGMAGVSAVYLAWYRRRRVMNAKREILSARFYLEGLLRDRWEKAGRWADAARGFAGPSDELDFLMKTVASLSGGFWRTDAAAGGQFLTGWSEWMQVEHQLSRAVRSAYAQGRARKSEEDSADADYRKDYESLIAVEKDIQMTIEHHNRMVDLYKHESRWTKRSFRGAAARDKSLTEKIPEREAETRWPVPASLHPYN